MHQRIFSSQAFRIFLPFLFCLMIGALRAAEPAVAPDAPAIPPVTSQPAPAAHAPGEPGVSHPAAAAAATGTPAADAHAGHDSAELERKEKLLAGPLPSYGMIAPFALLLGLIAILPLVHKLAHTWEKNSVKLMAALACAVPVLIYYGWFHAFPMEIEHDQLAKMTDVQIQQAADAGSAAGSSLGRLFHHAVLSDYIPFIVLLFSLYTISGGIQLKGDIPAHPGTNVTFLAVGALIASVVGTTGAAMLLIRPLLATNKERQRVKHTVIFFIFIVCNCGGLLLPLGDPPLFMGFLRGVDFWWTLHLWKEWLLVNGVLLITYYIWDTLEYKKEPKQAVVSDETQVEPLGLAGSANFLLLAGVVFCVATLDSNKAFLGTSFVPFQYMRELCMLALAGLSYFVMTPKGVREAVNFNFGGIQEVAALFIGIFLTMQIPVEILQRTGGELGVNTPVKFFWASGMLSSFLDNAPTYIVFFSTAKGMAAEELAKDPSVMSHMVHLLDGSYIDLHFLVGISLGSVFMGANTYIGNGPNFLVKSVAEGAGVKMPSFFGYMGYSICILIPIFIVLSLLMPYLL